MYKDWWIRSDIECYFVDKPLPSLPLRILKKFHRSRKVNRFLNLPWQFLWDKRLFDLARRNSFFIFTTGAMARLGASFLKRLRYQNPDLKMVLLIVDSMHAHSIHMPEAKPIIKNFPWDLTLSYDLYDCEEFGFTYLGDTIYSKLDGITPSGIQSDIYYVGQNKAGRNNEVIKIYNYLAAQGIKCNFNLVGRNKIKRGQNQSGLNFTSKSIPYENIIADVESSACILEVLQSGQRTQTIRYNESVCYNKKLLTNNPHVSDLPFYDDRYMKYFEKIEDIDIDWLKKPCDADFHYNNEFSPNHILDIINSYFCKMENK